MSFTIRHVPVDEVLNFDAHIAKFAAEAKELGLPVFVLVTGEAKKSTGKSWCSDCVKADPKIKAGLEGLKTGAMLIECPVERNSYKGMAVQCDGGSCMLKATDEKHPYRTHPKLALKAVPQLYKYDQESGFGDSLVEEDCYDDEKLAAFLA